jgi:8-oxo-dGTP pyrophosphatase MutT (NUDIX family)
MAVCRSPPRFKAPCAELTAALRTRLLASPPDPAGIGTGAAVLVPIIAGPQLRLLFTRRTAGLAHHSGQVSFPGGRSEAGDLSPLQTALRETQEETGIAPTFIGLAGYLPRLLTVTGFDVQPVVGVLSPGFTLTPDISEVAKIFHAPLAFFRDPANRRQETREHDGRSRVYYSFTYDGHEIWGTTAAIIVNLVTRLDGISSA